MKIHIVGASGSGKTTLAHQLADYCQFPHIELDALYWGPRWKPVATQTFLQTVTQLAQNESWIMDGNYEIVRPLIWGNVDMVIWLDYPRLFLLKRLFWRNFNYAIRRTNLWSSKNHEKLLWLLSPGSILCRSLKKHHTLHRQYPILMAAAEYAHVHFIRLRSHQETQLWLSSFVRSHGAATGSDREIQSRRQQSIQAVVISR